MGFKRDKHRENKKYYGGGSLNQKGRTVSRD